MFSRQMKQQNPVNQNIDSNEIHQTDRYGALKHNYHHQQQQQQRKQQRAGVKALDTKQPNESLRAKWNSIGLKVECDLIQRSLGKLVRATKTKCLAQLNASGQPAGARNKSGTAKHQQLRRSQSLRPTLAANGRQSSYNEVAPNKQRSPSLRLAGSQRSTSNCATNITSCQQNQPPVSSFKRNEFATSSLKHQAASSKANVTSAKTLVGSFLDKSIGKRGDGQNSAKINNRFRSFVGSCDNDKKTTTKDVQSTNGRKSSQSIRSLLSSAAASRRHVSRKQVANVQMLLPSGTKLMFAAGLALVLLLPLVVQLAAGAPISHFTRRIRPIWLADGLMTVADSSTLDPTRETSDMLEGQQSAYNNLIDRIQNNIDLQRQLEQQKQQQQQQQQQWAQPKRSWFSLSSSQGLNKPPAPAPASETFWVERRRLNRDRALEPPAWVRERPIRRDNSDTQREQQRLEELDPANRPIRARFVRGRQLRQSSGDFYDEVLKHLIEETLEGRAMIENIYDDLESKKSRLRELQGDSSARQSAANAKNTPIGATFDQAELPSTSEQDDATLRNSNSPEDMSDRSVIVAGDEISNDDDDISVLEVPRRPLMGQRQHQQQQQQSGQQSLLAVAQRLTKLPLAMQQTGELAESTPLGKSQAAYRLANSDASQTDTFSSGDSQDSSDLIGSLRLDSTQLAPAAAEETFHVIEDIDQADNSQEILQAPTVTSNGANTQADNAQMVQFIEAPAEWQLSQDDLDEQALRAKEKRSAELEEAERMASMNRATFGRGSAPELQNLPDDRLLEAESSDELADSSNSPIAGRNERSLSRPLNTVAPQSSAWNHSSSMAAGFQPPGVIAIQLIRSGYFKRSQLIHFATKLRIYLENSLQLPRGAILGLFPINPRQLLVELDLNKLESVDRQNLVDNFGYVRDSTSLVLNWPSGLDNRKQMASDNPLPILIAILDALYQDDGALGTATAAPTAPTNSQFQQEQKQAPTNELKAGAELPDAGEPLERQRAQDDLATARFGQSVDGLKVHEADELASPVRRQLWPIYEQRAPNVVQLMREARPQLAELPDAPATLMLTSEPQLNLIENGNGELDEEVLLAETPSELELDQASALLSSASNQQLALLAAYLSSVYGLEPEESLAAALNKQQVREQLGLALLRKPQLLVNKTADGPSPGLLKRLLAAARRKSARWYDSSASYFIVLALALMSTCLIVKLLVRKFDRRFVGGRKLCSFGGADDHDHSAGNRSHKHSFWSLRGRRASSSCSDESTGATIPGKTAQAGSSKQLGDASSLSADSGHETIGSGAAALERTTSRPRKVLRNSLDSLTQRWAKLTSKKQSATGAEFSGKDIDESAAMAMESGAVKEEAAAAAATQEAANEPAAVKGTFRSSTSYIRSLVEAITRAATSQQMSTSTTQTSGRYEPDEIDDLEAANEENSSSSSTCLIRSDNKRGQQQQQIKRRAAKRQQQQHQQQQQQLDDSDGAQEVLMSQMDISAAHLILDYMEKHLIDKERLRREWLELNAVNEGTKSAQGANNESNKQRANRNSKAQQLVLQRLAKTALAEENRAKNRDLSIVPFDRNRVRLGAGKRQRSSATDGNNNNNNDSVSNYVNASFIYDDDPRRPTHIVAQGPTERTCAHFWQMIWEQEISVIVMLTRLNENGHQMCHCYWPTDVNSNSAGEPNSSSSSNNNNNSTPTGPANGRSTAGRRGSVTSVYSGTNGGSHQSQPAAWPIVTSGELNDNVLVFELPLAQPGGSSLERDAEHNEAAASSSKRSTTLRLEVHLISEHVSSSDYLVRNMYLINADTGETRTICQFHYLAWPVGRTPDNVRNFLQFRRKVHKSYRNLKSPILVHCNDGAGRSGTYTLIDMILERIKNGAKEIDLRASLEHLRDQRVGLCETQTQFEFVLVALAEEIQIILNALPQ